MMESAFTITSAIQLLSGVGAARRRLLARRRPLAEILESMDLGRLGIPSDSPRAANRCFPGTLAARHPQRSRNQVLGASQARVTW